MAAGIYNMIIEQGATHTRSFTYTDDAGTAVNLSGYSARMMARAAYQSSATLFSVSTATSGLTIPTPANGTIVLTLTDAQTAALPCDGVYDLEIVSPSGVVTRLLQGLVTLSGEVTR
jgi:hypothetical protein